MMNTFTHSQRTVSNLSIGVQRSVGRNVVTFKVGDFVQVGGVVGTVTEKLVTPAGTVIVPSGFSVTPLLNTGAPMSPADAEPPPPRLNVKVVGVVLGLVSATL